jgi:hypothetical protein
MPLIHLPFPVPSSLQASSSTGKPITAPSPNTKKIFGAAGKRIEQRTVHTPESGSKEEKGMREWMDSARAEEVMMMLV